MKFSQQLKGRMSLGVLLPLGIVFAAASTFSAMGSDITKKSPNNLPPAADAKCVDYDPPNAADTITFNNVKYDLVKLDAGVQKEKISEMTLLGTLPDTRKIYVLKGGENYFGDNIGTDFVFAGNGTIRDNNYLFNIYLKDGTAVPESIKNCKKIGGSRTMAKYWEDKKFPPNAFNSSDVKNAVDLPAPAYIYDGVIKDKGEVLGLSGLKPEGELFVNTENASYPIYLHIDTAYMLKDQSAYEYIPTKQKVQEFGTQKNNLQLTWFLLVETPEYSWFTPICKPAIYLYPEKKQSVQVKVSTPGFFTLTIPKYPDDGWKITAEPNGNILSGEKTYPYLYYETKVPNSMINKPKEGYVAAYGEIKGLFNRLLRDAGFNEKEANDFKEYWNSALPYSPYYFIGVMPQEEIDKLEPLEVTPVPQTKIRVRFYFEALKNRIDVQMPQATQKKRNGFTLFEWGGMVNLNNGQSFTCSQ